MLFCVIITNFYNSSVLQIQNLQLAWVNSSEQKYLKKNACLIFIEMTWYSKLWTSHFIFSLRRIPH